jgi:hypothetical protein
LLVVSATYVGFTVADAVALWSVAYFTISTRILRPHPAAMIYLLTSLRPVSAQADLLLRAPPTCRGTIELFRASANDGVLVVPTAAIEALPAAAAAPVARVELTPSTAMLMAYPLPTPAIVPADRVVLAAARAAPVTC